MAFRLNSRIGLCAALAVCLVASSSFAQQDRGRGRGGFGGPGGFGGGTPPSSNILALAARPEVQEALGLTADEKDYVRLISDGIRDSMREAMQNQDGDFRERMQRVREIMAKQNKEAESQLAEAIGKDKVQRLKEIEIQIGGFRMLMDEDSDLAKDISLSEDQRDKLQAAAREVEEELQEIRRKKMEEKLLGLLSSSQKSKWEQKTGEPINFKLRTPRFERRGDGDGPGRGRGRGGRPDADPGT